MSTPKTLDDLEAVRTIAAALTGFDVEDQKRILRWASEKVGLPSESTYNDKRTLHEDKGDSGSGGAARQGDRGTPDIRSFVAEKNPRTDSQFAATVAFYHQFVAPDGERKKYITATDLQDACRTANRPRLSRPSQTLVNAQVAGLLDKGSETGAYTINSVGENLVAMTLPAGEGTTVRTRPAKKRASSKPSSKSSKKSSSAKVSKR